MKRFSIRNIISNWLNPPVYSQIPIYAEDGSVVYLNTTNPNVALSFTAVYACVNVISETISTLPFNLFENKKDKTVKAYNHPLYNILHYSPNEQTTSVTFWETTLTHLLLNGNSYSEIVRDYNGNIKSLNILEPGKVTVYKDGNGELFYRYFNKSGIVDLPRQKVLHIKGKSYDGLVGLSPISLFARTISTGIKQEELTNKFFASGARKLPIFTHPNAIKGDGRDRLKRDLRDAWDNSKLIFLEDGVTFNTATMNMTDAQLIESKVFSVSEIARIYRVPPHKIAELTHATFSNIEHQSIDFVRDTILPWCVRIESEVNHQLLSMFEKGNYFVKINTEALLRGDTVSRNTALEVQFRNGIINRKDWARLEDLPIPEDKHAEDYFITQQVRPLTMAYTDNKENTKESEENKNVKEEDNKEKDKENNNEENKNKEDTDNVSEE